MLQVRDLSVEVGGRFTLTGASFSLRAGDKVGLVGPQRRRQDLAAEGARRARRPPRRVSSRAPARSGTSRRIRRRAAPGSTAPRSRTCSRRAGSTPRAAASTSCTSGWPTTRRRATSARTATPRTRSATRAATPSDSEVRRIAAGLGLGADRLDLPITALSGGERRRVELTRILFAGSDLLLLDEPTNHLDIDAKQWLMQFLRSYRGGLLVISHDLELLDQAITRVLHIDEGELVEYRGTYSQYLVARQDDAERRTKLAARQTSEIDRLQALANSMRGQTEKRARTAKTLDHRVEKLTAEPRHRRARRAQGARAAARAAARGSGHARGRRSRQGVRAQDGVRRRHLRRRPRRADARARPQRRRQDDAAQDARRRARGRSRHGHARPPGVARLLRAGARGHRARAATCSSTCAT